MKSVIWAQFSKDKRNPILVLAFIIGSILATLFFAGGIQTPTKVAIFSEEVNAKEIEAKWEELLNVDDSLNFVVTDPDEAREEVRDGNIDVAVQLMEMDYRLLVTSKLPTVSMVRQHVDKVFQQEAQISSLISSTEDENVRGEVENYLADAPVQMEAQGLDSEEVPNYNMSIQLMFAFTFLISMFLVGFKVNNVTNDKVSGVWNRMILSPISKTSMYFGYILYSFLITMFQIVIVLVVFKYVMNYELGDNLWMLVLISAFFTFSMISIAMLLTGLVKSPEQFYAIYPSLIPLIPLVSGAYMMPGTISNQVLLFIADLFPMAHAMDALMSVIFYDANFSDILMSLLFMLLIGVISMGIGINLIERRGLNKGAK
ncbi:ABC transporter permease [Gracilibacillus salitolerans]|uniref:ABC transporter permease n=1 Tax=Gracilibacillus salitolerans TaxID=2663022 RepID=A0A5Q2TLS6_9BACI|nr:ABC transporter permease [Gracilibacillus salitolerans]QGH35919.1 ABC transporter permease [Gracilibacillus salitolerans]